MIQKGFPATATPAMYDFIKQTVTERAHLNFLFETDNRYIFSKENVNSKQQEVQYVSLTKDNLESFIQEPISNQANSFRIQKNDIDAHLELIDRDDEGLPKISIQDENKLLIETVKATKEFDLTKVLDKYEFSSTDDLIINLGAFTDKNMRIDVLFLENSTHVSLFVNHDLETTVTTQLFGNDLEETVQLKQLNAFESIFSPTDEPYKVIGANIWNPETNELHHIDEKDALSNDGKYIYINGKVDPLEDGEQIIQTVADYVQGNDTAYAQFSINFKALSEHLERDSNGDVSVADIVYFREDYIVLFANFNLPLVGTAGDTNIIIDLQEDKENPTFHVVDLGLH